MRAVILLLSLACYVMMTYSQECRQVLTTVCDNDVINSNMQKGESCVLGSLGTDIRTRLAKLEEFLIPRSCVSSLRHGPQRLASGVEVYCEDGWTIFQRRIDGSVDFGRRWDDYAKGFGQIDGEFWLGLDNIHKMTREGGCRLKIELWDFDGNQRHADYSSFSIESAENLYRLRVSGYSGNAGDSLSYNNGRPFSTEDSDNDSSNINCSTHFGGSQGWWFVGCGNSYLNGVWMRQSGGFYHGIVWYHWKKLREPLKETKMKLRCD
ncbi:ficolin-2-like [Clavelina lepadiformis]|uniref:ficolin-2-like n=1 Tax=Clavelina lepadiformis TaxID=159417 RepID=UPI004041E920